MSAGTGSPINIPREKLKARKHASFSNVSDYFKGSTPIVTSENLSTALEKYVNPFPEFAFEKISEVDFGSSTHLGQTTGRPMNRPDFINDYYFISMMRCIDRVTLPEYKGLIKLKYNTPSPTS